MITGFFKKALNLLKHRLGRKSVYYVNGSDTLPPPLDQEVEEELIERISEQRARDALIEHNLRLVVFIAKRFN